MAASSDRRPRLVPGCAVPSRRSARRAACRSGVLTGIGITLFFVVLAIFARESRRTPSTSTRSDGVRFPQLGAPLADASLRDERAVDGRDVAGHLRRADRARGRPARARDRAPDRRAARALLRYFGGPLDRMLVLFMDALFAFPFLLLAIVIAFLLSNTSVGQRDLHGRHLDHRRLHPAVLPRRPQPRDQRARGALRRGGARARRAARTVIRRYVFCNVVQNVPVIATLNAADAILTLAASASSATASSRPRAPSGATTPARVSRRQRRRSGGRRLFPGLAIVLLVTGLTLVGESLNDVLNPVLRTATLAPGRAPDAAATARGPSGSERRAPTASSTVRDLRVWYGGDPRARCGRSTASRSTSTPGEIARPGRRVGLRQVDARPRAHRPAARRARRPTARSLFDGRNLLTHAAEELRAAARPRHRADLPGADDAARPADADQRALRGGARSTTSRELSEARAAQRALETLGGMGIPPTRYDHYPHEFSGGMRQRIMIALALVLRPEVRRRRRADDRARRARRGADPAHPRRPASATSTPRSC